MAIDLMKYFYSKNKNSIKEIDDDIILIGRDKYLIEFVLYDKSYDYKFIYEFKNSILEINVLPDKTIIVFTQDNIILYNKKNNEYITKNKYIINNNWILETNNHFSSYILPNNRFLLNSCSIKSKEIPSS